MASNDYDDLLKSFMSNSTKAYNEDKTSRENGSNVPASYSLSSADDKKAKKIQRGRDIEKELVQKQEKKLKKKRAKQNKTPAQKALSNFGKVILGAVMVIGVVGIVCFSVLAIYGYSVVYGDPVFDKLRLSMVMTAMMLLKLQGFTVRKTVFGLILTI